MLFLRTPPIPTTGRLRGPASTPLPPPPHGGTSRRQPGHQFTGTEHDSRVSHFVLNCNCERVSAAKDAPRDPLRVFERRHGLAKISGRGTVVRVERYRISPPHPERVIVIITENASRHGNRFA